MARKLQDLTGKRFSRLLVLGISHKTSSDTYWDCQCDCGNTHKVQGGNLRSGSIKSCGCLGREVRFTNARTHGMTNTKIYGVWSAMLGRCQNPTDKSYKYYGGRGIKVCKRWQTFENFYADMGATRFKGSSIERIDVNGNYEPSNCIWIPLSAQANNKTTSVILDSPWGRMNVTHIANKIGIGICAMSYRLKRWPKERWFEPPHKSHQ